MRQTRLKVVPAAVLLTLLWLWGCSRIPEPNTAAAGADNQSAAAQAAGNGTDSNGNASHLVSLPLPLVIPAGTPITVRLQERLSSASAEPGERFDAVIDKPIVVNDQVVVPMGSPATGHVVLARHSGRLHHPGELGLTLDKMTVGQRNISLATSNVVVRGRSHKKRNLAWIGGSTAGGAVIGALAGGGKGALIGSGIGAAAGTTTAYITGKKDVAFGVEQRLRFRLNCDVSVFG